MKICTICKQEKPLSCFQNHTSHNGKAYFRRACKECYKPIKAEAHLKWRLEHPDKFLEACRRSNAKNSLNSVYRQKARDRSKQRKADDRRKYLLQSVRQRTRKSHIECTITENDIIIPEYCPLLGIRLELNNPKPMFNSPSIDRIDNSKGYVPGNVRVISYKANTMKNSATLEQMLIFVKNIIPYMTSTSKEQTTELCQSDLSSDQEALIPTTVQPECP